MSATHQLIIARQLAIIGHEGQVRRGGAPYIEHCHAVVSRLDDVIDRAVGWCHDLIEDKRMTIADLRAAGLSDEVLDGITTLTRLETETYEAFILRIKTHREGRWIKAKVADILANLADTPTKRAVIKYAKALVVLLDA